MASKATVKLTRPEFLARVRHRAFARYGLKIDQAWLNDLVKDRLLRRGRRAGNDGKRPIFTHDAVEYRRALRIVRLQSRGVVDRDAIRLILFINGYGLPTELARCALRREWPRNGKSVLAKIRSGYVNNRNKPKSKHRDSLIRQLGPLDARIAEAGVILDTGLIIEALRNAVQSPLLLEASHILAELGELVEGGEFDLHCMAETIAPMLSGMLMFDPDAGDDDESSDYFEGLIASASDTEIEKARDYLFATQCRISISLVKLGLITNSDAAAKLDKAIHYSVQRSGGWASSLLLVFLVFVRLFPAAPTIAEIVAMTTHFASGNFDITKLGPAELKLITLIAPIGA